MTILAQLDPATLERLGTAGIVAIILSTWLLWTLRQLAAERTANRELSERLVSTVEQALPILDRAERALTRAERDR